MIHVGICGTHSTGKTTLATALSNRMEKEFGNTVQIQEQVRGVCRDFGFKSVDHLLSHGPRWMAMFQWEALRRQVNIEAAVIAAEKNFVSDRTTIDNLAYYNVGQHGDDFMFMADKYREIAIANAKQRYHVILYVPPVLPIVDDGFRQVDPGFRNQIDREIKDLLAIYDIKHFTVTHVDREARVEQAMEYIREAAGNVQLSFL